MTSHLYLQPDLLLTWVPFKIKKTWRHALALEHMCESGGRCFLHYLRMHANPSTRPSLQFSKMMLPLMLSLQCSQRLLPLQSFTCKFFSSLHIGTSWRFHNLCTSSSPVHSGRAAFSANCHPPVRKYHSFFSLFCLLWHGCEFRWHNEVASN